MGVRHICKEEEIKAVKSIIDEFRRLQKSCQELMIATVKKHNIDISPEQSKLLFMVYHGKFLNQSDVAKTLNITPATLSVRIQRLENAGYLRRKIDVNDKRNYVLTVEPKGEALISLAHDAMNKVMLQLFEGFSSGDRQELMNYMNRLNQNVRNIKEEI
jgi:Transcriptional regulators